MDTIIHESLPDCRAGRIFDGLHVGHAASVAELQLRSEEFAMCGGSIGGNVPKTLGIPANVHLSRVTQRLARDTQALRDANEIRSKSAVPLLRENLLKQDSTLGVALRVPEDPIDSGFPSEPILPETSLTFGGEIGQWGENGSDVEKLGIILQASRHNSDANRSTLNIYVRNLQLEDHPLFIQEERLAVQLKRQFSQYSVLYERGAVFYLVRRLCSVIDTLEQLLQSPFAGEDSDEELMISYLAGDLHAALPAVAELRKTTQAISSSIYETWKAIKEERTKQGFTSTRVNLSVVAIKPTDASGGVDSGHGRDEVVDADIAWKRLRTRLHAVPDLLQRAYHRGGRPSVDGGSDEAVETTRSAKEIAARKEDAKSDEIIKTCIAELLGGPSSSSVEASSSRATRGGAPSARVADEGLIPVFVYILSEEGSITPDTGCPIPEQLRRRSIEKCVFRAQLSADKLIAGANDSSTHYIPLQFPGFYLDFSHLFQISVLHQPSDLKIDIFTNIEGSWSSDNLVSSIVVPIPGQHLADLITAVSSSNRKLPVTAAYAPIAAPYSFISSSSYTVTTNM